VDVAVEIKTKRDYELDKMGVIKVRKYVTNTAKQIFGNRKGL
jgi:hypothetical protein